MIAGSGACPFVYMGPHCGYAGDLPDCDKTIDGPMGCAFHGEDERKAGRIVMHPARYGGFPEVKEDPKPCPFCGGKARLQATLRDGHTPGEDGAWAYHLRCQSCACEGPWAKSVGWATRLWNMRA